MIRRLVQRRRPAGGERGAVLVMFALLIVVIVTFVAFAVDLGFGRSDRRTSRSLSDLAAVAAGYQLAGNADTDPFDPQSDPEAACRAAIESVRDNADDFDPPASASDGCADFDPCPASPDTLTVADGPWTLTITYPVPNSAITDANLGGDGLSEFDGEPCERMSIALDHTRDTFFAGVIGVPRVETGGGAVVVAEIPDPSDRVVPAFLMLDRTACKAIWTNVGQGTEAPDPTLLFGDGILVRRGSDGQPGFIHTDSDATACGNAANDYAIYANEPSGGDTMVVQAGTDSDGNAAVGVIESTATNGRSGAGGTNVPVGSSDLVGRAPVDEVFSTSISGLHTSAYAAVSSTAAPATGTVITYGCNGVPTSPEPATGAWTAFINCPSFSGSFSKPATTVVFSGELNVRNNDIVSFLLATEVTVRGRLNVDGRLALPAVGRLYVGERFTVGGNGVVGINTSTFDTAAAPTPTNPGCRMADVFPGVGLGALPGYGADSSRSTAVVVFNPVSGNTQSSPALSSAGRLTMCQTTVYLAGEKNDATYVEKSIEAGAGCDEDYPCPWVNGNDVPGARFDLSGNVQWFAPNQYPDSSPPNRALPGGGIEDLAAWGEGGGASNSLEASRISGGGTTFAYSGVFFSPNAKVELSAGNANTGPTDAQFIARILQVNGGRFEMQPSKQNAVPVPIRGSFQLIR